MRHTDRGRIARMSALEKTLRWVVLTGVFALPFICFIVTTSLFFPYITGKNFAFRFIVEVISAAWLALALVSPAYRPRRSWILGSFALFVLVMAIADAQGVHPFKSFWSNFERMDGWVTLGHLMLLLAVSVSVLTTEKLWRRFWQTSLAVSVVVAVYGFLQIAGALALGEGGSAGLSARIDATFGNPIYLAVYMLFHVFIAAMLWIQARAEKYFGLWAPLSLWYLSAIALDTFALLATGTRGTTLGLVGGGLLALLLFALTPDASKKVRRATVVALSVVVVISGLLWVSRDTALVKSVGILDRLASISVSDGTIKARFLNMGIAWQGVKERPLLGWGQENYAIVFDKYYDPQMYAQEPWFDRVHNSIFDWLIAGGFLGLLSYLFIFLATLYVLWKRGNGFSFAEKSLFTGLLAGYFFHNLTVFDNVTSYILFVFVLAYIASRSGAASGATPLPQGRVLSLTTLPFVTVGCAFVFGGLAWFVNANALAQNRTLLTALTPQQSGVLANLALFKQAIAYGSYGTQEAREQLAQGATQVASAQGADTSTKQQFFDTATQEMALQAEASPLDARFPLFLGILEDNYGDYKDAAVALEKAHELSPNKQTILFQIALNKLAQNDVSGSLATFKQAYELAPEFREARLYYAGAAIQAGQDSLANELLAPLISSGEAADPRISAAYADRGAYGKIIQIWSAHVKAQPKDVQGYFTLAAAYLGAGDSANAIATLQSAESLSPAVATQAEGLIQQIRNGTAKIR